MQVFLALILLLAASANAQVDCDSPAACENFAVDWLDNTYEPEMRAFYENYVQKDWEYNTNINDENAAASVRNTSETAFPFVISFIFRALLTRNWPLTRSRPGWITLLSSTRKRFPTQRSSGGWTRWRTSVWRPSRMKSCLRYVIISEASWVNFVNALLISV